MDVFFEGLKELAAVSKPHSAQFMVVSLFFGVGFGRFYGRCSLDGARPLIDSPILRLLVFICFFRRPSNSDRMLSTFPDIVVQKKQTNKATKPKRIPSSLMKDHRGFLVRCCRVVCFFAGHFLTAAHFPIASVSLVSRQKWRRFFYCDRQFYSRR